jgi:hypothetical protein
MSTAGVATLRNVVVQPAIPLVSQVGTTDCSVLRNVETDYGAHAVSY